MRVAFDGRWLVRGGPPSLRRLSREVFVALGNIAGVSVVAFTPHADEVPPWVKNADEIISVPRLPHPIMNGAVLPILARRYHCDAMLLQNFGPMVPYHPPCVLLVHDAMFLTRPDLFDLKERAYFSLIQPCARRAGVVATGSQTELQRMHQAQFLRSRQTAIAVYNGVRPIPECDTQTVALSDRPFLALGRQNRRKRVASAIHAMAHPLSPPGAQLDIVGPVDNATGLLYDLIGQYGLQRRVRLVGQVTDDQVNDYLRNCRALVYLSEDEGFGLPPVEAMAAGVPAVLSDIAVHREISQDAALYVDPQDIAQIAQVLVEVSDPAIRQRLQTAARIRSPRFTWENTAIQLGQALKMVCAA